MIDVQERLIQCFEGVFPGLSRDEILRASPASVGAWDSVATVTLVGVIEEEFGASVAPEDIENFVSFELVLDYLRTAQGAAGASQAAT
jgi:acyl carrier protein